MPLINGVNDLYLQNKLFKIILKPNSYLTSIFCHDQVNLSTLTFPNTSLKKAVENLYVVSNVTEKSCNNFYLLLKVFHRSSKSNSHLMSISSRARVPNFWLYQSDRNSDKFICCQEIQSKKLK